MEKEFLEVISCNSRIIYKVIYIYSDQASVDDLYQEVVLNLWKSFPRFRHESNYSTWIYRVALNTCVTVFRKEKNRPTHVPIISGLDEVFESEVMDLEIEELHSLINKLNKWDRAIIFLYLEDRPYKEIANLMGITPTNVSTKINRIKEALINLSNE